MATKIELNSAGIQEILKSAGVSGLCKEHADRIAAKCGDGYESDLVIGQKRAVAGVRAVTRKARRDNAKHNTLLKAVN